MDTVMTMLAVFLFVVAALGAVWVVADPLCWAARRDAPTACDLNARGAGALGAVALLATLTALVDARVLLNVVCLAALAALVWIASAARGRGATPAFSAATQPAADAADAYWPGCWPALGRICALAPFAAIPASRIGTLPLQLLLVLGATGLAAGLSCSVARRRQRATSAYRLARAQAARRVGEAYALLLERDARDAALTYARDALPDWPIRAALLAASGELLDLRGALAAARALGAPPAGLSRIEANARHATVLLADCVGRLSATAACAADTPAVQQALVTEEEQLAQLRAALHDAREGLAELTLASSSAYPELDAVVARFRVAAATARRSAALLRELDGEALAPEAVRV